MSETLEQTEWPVTTICQQCVFATYDLYDDRLVQSGCEANRLHKFESRLESADVKQGNKEYRKHFYRLKGICNYCRNSNWLKPLESKEDAVSRVIEETEIKYNAIIFATRYHDVEDIEITWKSLSGSSLPPEKITIIVEDQQYTIPSIKQHFDNVRQTSPVADYNIFLNLADTKDHWYMIDKNTDRTKYNFFTIANAGYRYAAYRFTKIQYLTNELLMPVYGVCPTEGKNGLVLNTSIYKAIRLQDKKQDPLDLMWLKMAEQQKTQYFLKEEEFNSLQLEPARC